MQTVVLINLPIKNIASDLHLRGYNPSLGLLSLGTYLELHGYKVIIIDLCYSKRLIGDIIDIVMENNPVLVGISTYTENINLGISYAKYIKSSVPGTNILFGGPHVTVAPEDGIKSRYVDFVALKEGEAVILELVEAISTNEEVIKFEDINGILFRRNGNVIKNKLRSSINDLDILPIQKRELVGLENYTDFVHMTTSRGCPGNCIYCSATALSGASYRTRAIENVFLEIVLLKFCLKERFSEIYIVDDTFTAMPRRVERFSEYIDRYKLKFLWSCESRVDVMTEDLLIRMKNAGCISVQYGIESGSQTVLDQIRKNIDLDSAKKVIDVTHKAGISVALSFMIGHYCDTKETMEETASFIKELYEAYKAKIGISFNTPFPGTWQYTHRDELGLRLVSDDYSKYDLNTPIVETDNFTTEDQLSVYFKVIAHAWNF